MTEERINEIAAKYYQRITSGHNRLSAVAAAIREALAEEAANQKETAERKWTRETGND